MTGDYIPYNVALKERAKELRKNMTKAEKRLWFEYLKDFKYPVLRQKPLDNFIADFYCSELRLVIELDGEQHYTEEGKKYDEERTAILEDYGLKVLRFSNYEVFNDFEEVRKKIEAIPRPDGHPLYQVGKEQ